MEARFLKYVNKTDTCWLWTGSKSYGYGQFNFDNRNCRAHRYAYEMWVGPIPSGLVLRHKCDNPICVNPDHLETGTQQDNINDRNARGRQAKGEKQHLAKLTEDDVVEIKVLLGFGMSNRQIARQFGVSESIISNIKRGKTWAHVIPSSPSRSPPQSLAAPPERGASHPKQMAC